MRHFCLVVTLVFCALGTVLSQTTVTTNGGTVNSVPKFTGTSTIGNSAITENNGNVGIGTTNPITTLAVQATNATAFLFGYGVSGGSFTPTLGSFASEGTPASPSPILAGDRLLSLFNAGQFDTTPGDFISGASIEFFADENYASNRNGTDIRFSTAANNSGAARAERMRIDNTGDVGIGTTTPGQKLEVDGSIKLTAGSGGSLIFADGSVQTTATSPTTSASCSTVTDPTQAPSCSSICTKGVVTQQSISHNSSCQVTSTTGSCTAQTGSTNEASCCVCKQN